jgi:hypothetical protein
MEAYGGVDVQINLFLTSALDGEWTASHPGRFAPWEIAPFDSRLDGPQNRSGRRGEGPRLSSP